MPVDGTVWIVLHVSENLSLENDQCLLQCYSPGICRTAPYVVGSGHRYETNEFRWDGMKLHFWQVIRLL